MDYHKLTKKELIGEIERLKKHNQNLEYQGLPNNIFSTQGNDKMNVPFLDNSFDLLALLDKQGKFIYCNQAYKTLLGYDFEELKDTLANDIVHPDDLEESMRKVLYAFENHQKKSEVTARIRTKAGNYKWLRHRFSILKGTWENEPVVQVNGFDVTDLKTNELNIATNSRRTELLLDLFSTEQHLTVQEVCSKALDIAVEVTNSKIGFIHQISEDQSGILLTAWNETTLQNCTAVYNSHYPVKEAGNWADCIRSKKPEVFNNYSVSPNQKGLPQGHIPVERMISIPVVYENTVRLIFGVGNKEDNYNDFDVQQIEIIAAEINKILIKRKIEGELKKQEERWQFAIEGSDDGIWDWNLLDDKVFFSHRWKEMIGYDPDELSDNLYEWKNRVHPGDLPEVLEVLKRHLDGTTPVYQTNHRLQCRDGSWKWIQDRGKIIERTPDGKPLRMVGTHRDITEKVLNEKSIVKLNERITLANKAACIGVWDWNITENLLEWDDNMYKIYGRTKEQFTNAYEAWLDSVYPEDKPAADKISLDARQGKRDYHTSFRILMPDKTTRHIKAFGDVFFDEHNNAKRMVGINYDITDQIAREETLRQSVALFQSAFHFAATGMALVSFQGKLLKVNPSLCEFFGYNEKELLSKTFMEISYPEDLQKDLDYIDQLLKGEINSYQMEKRYFHKTGKIIWALLSVSLVRDAEGSPDFLIGQVQDITNRMEAEQSLLEDKKIFSTLNLLMSDYIFKLVYQTGDDYLMEVVAGNYTRATGRDPREIRSKTDWNKIIWPDDLEKFSQNFSLVLEQKQTVSFECRSIASDGSLRWLEVIASPDKEKDSTGYPDIYGSVKNITEKKLSEQSLKESENKYRQLIENLHAGVVVHQPDTSIALINQEAFRMLGLDSKLLPEIKADNPSWFFTDESGKRITPDAYPVNEVLKSKSPFTNRTFGIQQISTNQLVWVQVNAYPEFYPDHSIKQIVVTFVDVTERKIAEEKLAASEERWRSIIKTSPDGISITSLDGIIHYVSDNLVKWHGFSSAEEMTGMKALDFVTPEYKKQAEVRLAAMLNNEYSGAAEYELYRKDKSTFFVEVTAEFLKDQNGNPEGIFMIERDITERKKTENALRKSEALLRETQKIGKMGGWEYNVKTRESSFTDETFEIYGTRFVTAEEGAGFYHPDDLEIVWKTFQDALEKQIPYDIEVRLINAKNELRWVRSIGKPVVQDGKTTRVSGILADITEQKITRDTHEFLLNRERHFIKGDYFGSLSAYLSEMLQTEHVIIGQIDKEDYTTGDHKLYSNGKFSRIEKYTFADSPVNELISHGFFVCPENVSDKFPNDLLLKQIKAESYSGILLKDSKGTPNGYLAVIGQKAGNYQSKHELLLKLVSLHTGNEIERIEVERQLKTTLDELHKTNTLLEEKIRERTREITELSNYHKAILDNAPFAILTTTPDGIFRTANPASEKMLGYTIDEIVGKLNPLHFHDIDEMVRVYSEITGQKNPDLPDLYNTILGYLYHKTTEWTWIKKDGTRFPVQMSHSTIYNQDGSVLGYMGLIFDITQQKKAMEALRKSEAENRAIIQAVPDLMFRIRKDGTYLDSYSKNEKSLYAGKDQFIGKKIKDVLPAETAETAISAIEKAFAVNDIVHYEYELEINRQIRNFENRITVISDDEVLSIIRDITVQKTAQKNLQEAISKLTILIQNLQAGTLFEDTNRKITLVNESFCRLFNIDASPEQLIGIDCALALEESKNMMKDPIGFIDRIMEILESRKIVVNDELQLNDGRVFERDYIPITEDNELLGHLWQYRDITARKAAEAALKMQNNAFESLALAIFITDKNGIIQWANSSFTNLTGYAVEETKGKRPGELIKSGEQPPEFYRDLWETILNGKVWSGELINKKKDGSLYFEEETITPVFDHEGNIANFIAIKIDITQRKMIEQALRESEARWKFALEGAGDGVWDWDLIQNKMFYSRQWKEMLGYAPEEIGNSVSEWESRIHADDQEQCYESHQKHFNGETDIYVSEYRMLCKDGSFKWILDRGKIVKWSEDGKPARMIGTHTDITERKHLEESLLNTIAKEKELNELKSRFMSMASHEFRTPLASILMSGETLLSYWEKMNKQQIDSKLENIRSKVIHLNKIVSSVMQANTSKEVNTPDFTELDLVGLCHNMVDDFNNTANDLKSVRFRTNTESLRIRADERHMIQIIDNLVSNALKYSPINQEVLVDLTLEKNEIRFIVEDHGVGIPEADQKYLFEPFFRAGNVGRTEGNGLGLNIVYESVKLHHGKINVESKTDKGSRFTVTFPLYLLVDRKLK